MISRIDFRGQREPAHEQAVLSFDTAELLSLFFLLLLTLALNAQHAVLQLDLDVIFLDLRQIGLHDVVGVGFLDVDRRRLVGKRKWLAGKFPRKAAACVVEDVAQARLHVLEFPEGIPFGDFRGNFSFTFATSS